MITLTRTISVLGNPLSSIARTIISLQQSPQLHATFQFNFQFKSKEHTHKHIFFHHNQRLPRSSRNKCLIIQLEYINVIYSSAVRSFWRYRKNSRNIQICDFGFFQLPLSFRYLFCLPSLWLSSIFLLTNNIIPFSDLYYSLSRLVSATK